MMTINDVPWFQPANKAVRQCPVAICFHAWRFEAMAEISNKEWDDAVLLNNLDAIKRFRLEIAFLSCQELMMRELGYIPA